MRADAEAALDRNARSQGAKVAAAAQELQELQASLTGAGEARAHSKVSCAAAVQSSCTSLPRRPA